MVLMPRDKLALRIAAVAWIVCGILALIFRSPWLLLIALGVTWVCGQAVIRVTPVECSTPKSPEKRP